MIYNEEAKNKYYGTLPINEAEALDKYLEADILSEALGEYGIISEYKGSEFKTNQFISALEDIDELVKLFKEDNDQVTGDIEKLLSMYKKAKKSKDFGTIMATYDDYLRKFSEDSKKRFSTITNGKQRWKTLASTAKKFSNKYSEMGMSTRENFDKKFQKYLEDMKKRKDRLKEINEDLNKAWDTAKKVDYEYADKAYGKIFKYLEFAFKDCQLNIRDLMYVIDILNVSGIKSSLIYNILNKDKNANLKKGK